MIMKQKNTLLYVSLLIGMSLSAQPQGRIPEQSAGLVKEAAMENASTFLQLIPQGQEKEYGFGNRNDFSKIKIEEPFQMYYMGYKENKLGFVQANEWRVPISVEGKYIALLTVAFYEGKAQVVDFGANGLAQKLQESIQQSIIGSERILIRSTYLSRDFVTTDFAGLSKSPDAKGFMELNMDSAQTMYQLNEGTATAVSVSTLYVNTTAAMSNMAQE
jgi:hypothetical protein